MKPDVLIASRTLPRQMAELEARYTLHRLDLAEDPAALIARISETCEVMVSSGHVLLDREFLAHLPKLKLVAISSAGFDMIDVAALTARRVTLTNTPDVLTDDVADMALMLMLAARRGLLLGDRHVRSGAWEREGPIPLMSSTAGKRAGIVGLGRIGQAIASRCTAFGLEVGYWGRSKKPDVPYAHFTDLVQLASWSDILFVATAGGDATRGLISAEVIAELGPKGCFINISRGTLVDEAALIAALQSGALGSAGLDVFLNEPSPDPAFAKLDNVVLAPHHASGTVEARDAMSQLVVDNVAAYFAGKPLLTPVN